MKKNANYLEDNKNNQLVPYVLFFFAGCFLGFIWEVLVYWLNHRLEMTIFEVIGELRGFLNGPWVPIYGFGCLLMRILRERFPGKPMQFFIASVLACSAIEFVTSWVMEAAFGARWWDYSEQFLNLDGRICLLVSLFFGAAGMLVVYVLEPLFQGMLSRVSWRWRKVGCILLAVLFILDIVISLNAPNMGIGVTLMG